MKILQVVTSFPPAYAFGGPPRTAYEIAKTLAERKHQVTVYTSDAKDPESRLKVGSVKAVNGMKVYYFRNLTMMTVKMSNLFITPQLVTAAREEIKEFDVVHLHEYRSFQNIVSHHYARKEGVPYVVQAHGSLPRIMEKQSPKLIYDILFGNKLLSDASKVIALNQMEFGQYRSMQVPEDKIEIIPNGIDLLEFNHLPAEGSFKKKHGIPEGRKVILCLGRINKIKGIDFLIEAYARLVKSGGCNEATLVIAGPDDGYLGEVRMLMNSLKLRDKLLLVGPLYGKDKLEAFVDAEVFVLPSRYETFPKVVLEVYACSKPVIASNIESLRNLVIQGRTGFLFESGNVSALAHHLEYLLENPRDARKMGHEARRFVESKFPLHKVIERLESLYREVASTTKKEGNR